MANATKVEFDALTEDWPKEDPTPDIPFEIDDQGIPVHPKVNPALDSSNNYINTADLARGVKGLIPEFAQPALSALADSAFPLKRFVPGANTPIDTAPGTDIPVGGNVARTWQGVGHAANNAKLAWEQMLAPKTPTLSSLITGETPYDQVNQKVRENEVLSRGLMDTKAGKFGNLLPNILSTAAASETLPVQMAVQGGWGGLMEPSVDPSQDLWKSRLATGAEDAGGAMLGYGLFKGAGNLVRPFRNALPEMGLQGSYDTLKKYGLDKILDASQATGDKMARVLKGGINTFSDKGSNFVKDVQLPAVTERVLQAFGGLQVPGVKAALTKVIKPGEGLTRATPEVVKTINDSLNKFTHEVHLTNPIHITDNTPAFDLHGLNDTLYPRPGTAGSFNDALEAVAESVRRGKGGSLDGNPVLNIISKLRTEARANEGVIPADTLEAQRDAIRNLWQDNYAKQGGQLSDILDMALATQAKDPKTAYFYRQAIAAQSNMYYIQRALRNSMAANKEGVHIDLPTLAKVMTAPSHTGDVTEEFTTPATQSMFQLAKAGRRLMEPEAEGLPKTIARGTKSSIMGSGLSYLGANLVNANPTMAGIAAATGTAAPIAAVPSIFGGFPREAAIYTAHSPFWKALHEQIAPKAGAAYGGSTTNQLFNSLAPAGDTILHNALNDKDKK